MSSIFKKIIVVVLTLTVLMGFTACKAKSKVNVNAPQASITDEWTFEHALKQGENVPRFIFDSDKNLPQFTSDGTNFTFNIVPGKNYSGTIEKIDDSNYVLYKDGSHDKALPATIAGNSLTLYVSDDTYVVYVVKK